MSFSLQEKETERLGALAKKLTAELESVRTAEPLESPDHEGEVRWPLSPLARLMIRAPSLKSGSRRWNRQDPHGPQFAVATVATALPLRLLSTKPGGVGKTETLLEKNKRLREASEANLETARKQL